MDELRFEDVIFGAENLRTRSCVVSCNNLRQVDDAIRILTERHVLGVEIFYDSTDVTTDGPSYEEISALSISNGDYTVIFATKSEQLPMAISLLMSHQDYIKIGFNTRHDKVGRMYRDWNVLPAPLHDVDDILYSTVDASNFGEAVRSVLPGCTFKVDPAILHGRWSHRLTEGQTNVASFYGWGIRRMWLDLADPQGFPPIAKTQPVKVADLVSGMRCPHCSSRFHTRNALAFHMQHDHVFECECCGEVFTNPDDLADHLGKNHVQCQCGTWVTDDHMLMVHNTKFHEIRCLASACRKIFDDKESRLFHMQTEHVKCQVCGSWFMNLRDCNLHADVAHPCCDLCGRVFKTAKELQKHIYARVNGICYNKSTGRDRGVGAERVIVPNGQSTPSKTSTKRTHSTSADSFAKSTFDPNTSRRSINSRDNGLDKNNPLNSQRSGDMDRTGSGDLDRTSLLKSQRSGVELLSRTAVVATPRVIKGSSRHRSVFSSKAQSHRIGNDELTYSQRREQTERDGDGGDSDNDSYFEEEGNTSYLELNSSMQRSIIHHKPPSKVGERDEGWIPPPYHMPVPLQLAQSAATVGLYG